MEIVRTMEGTLEVTRLGRKARSLVDTGEPLSKVVLRIGDGELEWELHYSVGRRLRD